MPSENQKWWKTLNSHLYQEANPFSITAENVVTKEMQSSQEQGQSLATKSADSAWPLINRFFTLWGELWVCNSEHEAWTEILAMQNVSSTYFRKLAQYIGISV